MYYDGGRAELAPARREEGLISTHPHSLESTKWRLPQNLRACPNFLRSPRPGVPKEPKVRKGSFSKMHP